MGAQSGARHPEGSRARIDRSSAVPRLDRPPFGGHVRSRTHKAATHWLPRGPFPAIHSGGDQLRGATPLADEPAPSDVGLSRPDVLPRLFRRPGPTAIQIVHRRRRDNTVDDDGSQDDQ